MHMHECTLSVFSVVISISDSEVSLSICTTSYGCSKIAENQVVRTITANVRLFLCMMLFGFFPSHLFSVLGILIKSYVAIGIFCGIFLLENLATLRKSPAM